MARRAMMALGARTAARAAAAAPALSASPLSCGGRAAVSALRSAHRCRASAPERPILPAGRQIHSSAAARKDAGKPDEAEAASADGGGGGGPKEPTQYEKDIAAAEARDPSLGPVPAWQNPRHHANPAKSRVFYDEFDEGEVPETVPLPPFDDGTGGVVASPELHGIAEEILTFNMLEVKELVDRIGEHFGLEDGPMMMVGGGGGAAAEGGEAAAAAEEEEEVKTAFDLKLVGFDAKAKIKVIKEVRAAAGLGLKEAKELVEGAPKVVKKDMKKEEAEELKAKLEEVGATVEIV